MWVNKAFHPHLLQNPQSHYPAFSPNLLLGSASKRLPNIWLRLLRCSNITVTPQLSDVLLIPGKIGATSSSVIVLFYSTDILLPLWLIKALHRLTFHRNAKPSPALCEDN